MGKSIIAIKYSLSPKGKYNTQIIMASLNVSSGFKWSNSLVKGIDYNNFLSYLLIIFIHIPLISKEIINGIRVRIIIDLSPYLII